MKVWVNGELVDKEQARISVFDHGLLYGDGVFEGIRVYGGEIFRCADHVDRLFASAEAVRLPMPVSRLRSDRRRASFGSFTNGTARGLIRLTM